MQKSNSDNDITTAVKPFVRRSHSVRLHGGLTLHNIKGTVHKINSREDRCLKELKADPLYHHRVTSISSNSR